MWRPRKHWHGGGARHSPRLHTVIDLDPHGAQLIAEPIGVCELAADACRKALCEERVHTRLVNGRSIAFGAAVVMAMATVAAAAAALAGREMVADHALRLATHAARGDEAALLDHGGIGSCQPWLWHLDIREERRAGRRSFGRRQGKCGPHSEVHKVLERTAHLKAVKGGRFEQLVRWRRIFQASHAAR
jgi:hypothetical protein